MMRWYSKLVATDCSVFSSYNYQDLLSKFIVCQNVYSKQRNKIEHRFAVFPSFVHFFRWYVKIPQDEHKSYYEIILPEKLQKPRFDIDVSGENNCMQLGEQVFVAVLNALVSYFGDTLSIEKDVCVYTSHGSNKYSVHIVLNHWMHANQQEAKEFGRYIIRSLPNEINGQPWDPRWVDQGVYGRNQQFRLLGSTKYGANRHKQLLSTFNYKDREITKTYDEVVYDSDLELQLIQFEESLVSFAGNGKMVPPLQKIELYTTLSSSLDVNEISDNELSTVQTFIEKQFGTNAFEVRGNENGYLYLTRLVPTYCSLCKRSHEHENPYIRIDKKDGLCSVLFYCRRDLQNRPITIGEYVSKSTSPSPSPVLPPLAVVDDTELSISIFDPPVSTEEDEINIIMKQDRLVKKAPSMKKKKIMIY